MNPCTLIQLQLDEYLDGRLTGVQMQKIAAHLENCTSCAYEWSALRGTQSALSALMPAPVPAELPQLIHLAIAEERARAARNRFAEWKQTWCETVGPFVFRASAGFASAVLLIGTVALMVGMFAQPEQALASDEPIGMATAPHFRYLASGATSNQLKIVSPVVVEVSVNRFGEVCDYRIVSGPNDANTRIQVESLLLSSVFSPAQYFGKPVHGLAILSFSGVAVRG